MTSGELSPGGPQGPKEEFSLGEIAGRMEIISPRDISLAKFLGSGGYGEVRPRAPALISKAQ